MARSTWGSIRQKDRGVWEVRYPLPRDPSTGKRRQGSKTVRGTRKAAEQLLAELRAEHGADGDSVGPCMTVRRCWTRHYRPYIGDLSPSTVKGYESAYASHIEPTFGCRIMEDIGPAEVQRWLDEMSYGAAKKSFAVMRALFNFAADQELLVRNVMDRRFKLPRRSSAARMVCEDIHDLGTLKAVLADCRGEVWEPGFIFSAFGGLRRSEACGVQRPDVEFAEGYAIVRVRRGVQCIDGVVRETSVKTEASELMAIIPRPFSDRLLELVRSRPGELWMLDDGFGNPLNPDTLAKAYQRWFQQSAHRYIPWKNLRNSYATMLHEAGVELGMIAKLLGHSTPVTTFKHYDKPSAEALAAIVSRLGD